MRSFILRAILLFPLSGPITLACAGAQVLSAGPAVKLGPAAMANPLWHGEHGYRRLDLDPPLTLRPTAGGLPNDFLVVAW